MKVALVHDFLTEFGEKEEVLFELAKIFPEAPIYTIFYDEAKMWNLFPSQRVRVSFLQKFPEFLKKNKKLIFPLLPIAPETFDLRDFDLVISSSSGFAKGIITRPKTLHISYSHSVMDFAWAGNPEKTGIFTALVLNYLRLWDKSASKRVDYFIANCRETAERIWKYYRREAKVVFPPVREPFLLENSDIENKDFFLVVSSLNKKKEVGSIVEAFNKMELPLVVVGQGKFEGYFRKIAGSKVRLVNSEEGQYYKNCLALVLPRSQDFGLAAVKAMSFGKPILAPNSGAAPDFVLPGMIGELFEGNSAEAIADGIRRLRENFSGYSPLVISKWAQRFSPERFNLELEESIRKAKESYANRS